MEAGTVTPDARIAAIASSQHGCFSRQQAMRCGFSNGSIADRLAVGRWLGPHAGVYSIAGVPDTWSGRVLAACLAAGPCAVASGTTASTLWAITVRRPQVPEVSVPYGKHPRGDGFRVQRSRVDLEPTAVDGIPVTSARRTLLDLAALLEPDELEETLDASLRSQLVTPREMTTYLSAIPSGRRGVGRLARLVSARDGSRPSESVFETRVFGVLRAGGLPLPVRQAPIYVGGRVVARADLCYPEERVVIELDGYRDHSSRRAFDKDRVRQNMLTGAGWLVLRFTWSDLGRPRYVCDTVRRVLFERGHPDVSSL